MNTNLSVANNENTLHALGKLLTPGDPSIVRDAVHIAVIPVVAGEILKPNDDIGFDGQMLASKHALKKLGKVDPLLKKPVNIGECFFMWVYPGTINTLHHNWTHVDIPNEYQSVTGGLDSSAKGQAIAWITDYAQNECDGLSYEEMVDAADNYLRHGDYLSEGGRFEGTSVSDEFWNQYQTAVGKTVSQGDRGSFFSCSC